MISRDQTGSGQRFSCSAVTKLLDMRDGYAPIRNILGMSDPSVARVDGRWTMFIGGMGAAFRTNLLTARLPEGDTLASDRWEFELVPGSRWRAQRLIPQPPRGSWNRCLHSVCHVRGRVDGVDVERIYHAGRSAETVLSTTSPYRIGFLERRNGRWVARPQPLEIAGLGTGKGVLEPKVEHVDGSWHLRYLALTQPGDDKDGNHTILYSRSADGVTGWSEPTVFSDASAGYYDSVALPDRAGSGYLLALTRDSNLFGKPNYPSQGLWLADSADYATTLRGWSSPSLVVDPDDDRDGWYRGGMCSPSLQWSDDPDEPDVLYAFFVTATEHCPWPARAVRALRAGHLPPVPSPFYFAVGKARIEVHPRRTIPKSSL